MSTQDRIPVIASSKRAMDDYLIFHDLDRGNYSYMGKPEYLRGMQPEEVLILGWPDLRLWTDTLAVSEGLGTKIRYSAVEAEEALQL